MILNKPQRALLGAAIAATLMVGGLTNTADAAARKEKPAAAPAAEAKRFPNATRTEPSAKDAQTTQENNKAINAIAKDYQDPAKRAETLQAIDQILANPKSNAYDKSFAAQVGGLISNQAGDNAKSVAYFRQAVAANGMDNNGHFETLFNLAIVQTQMKDFAGAIATLEQFLNESKSTMPEARFMLAQNFYESGKFAEAATQAKLALDAKPDAEANWKQLYMLALSKSGNAGDALKQAQEMAAANPTDKTAQMNYTALLLQGNRNAEALAVMEKMRTNKLLTTDTDYRNLFVTLNQKQGSEKAVIEVIQEGLASKVLNEDYQVDLALAQAYFFSGQEGKAIEYYEKAGPASQNGETFLNLARIYWQQGRNAEAKATARKAQAKGVKDDKDIKRILALPDKGGNSVILEKKK